jgi:hypothetical protein
MYDLVNEPDNKRIFWTERKGRPSLAKLYFDAMDAIQRVQPDAIFVLEASMALWGVRKGHGRGGRECCS